MPYLFSKGSLAWRPRSSFANNITEDYARAFTVHDTGCSHNINVLNNTLGRPALGTVANMTHPGFAEAIEDSTKASVSRFFCFDNTIFSASLHNQ
jgi:hypothetical protein